MSIVNKLGWISALILALALMAGAYVFIVAGKTIPASDGRIEVLLSEGERDKVLGEMRGMLETIQGIVEALTENDLGTVETLARASGMAATKGETPAMMAKLPLELKQLGFGTHSAFDDLADLAATRPEPNVVLGAVGDLMLNCTACHASYRFGIEPGAGD